MTIETQDHIQQFLTLQKKSETELKAICEGLKMSTEGTKEELIEQILQLPNVHQQAPVIKAQAIPLRTRDDRSEPLEDAIKAFKGWRKMIFESRSNMKEFQLLNGKGKPYNRRMKYLNCSDKTALHIIRKGWYLPLDHHRDLIEMLKEEPSNFLLHIVQKPDSSGNSWLMLHVEPKKKAA